MVAAVASVASVLLVGVADLAVATLRHVPRTGADASEQPVVAAV